MAFTTLERALHERNAREGHRTDIIGYVDRLSVAPGDALRCMVSSRSTQFAASLLRLRHGDRNPDGPGVRETQVVSLVDGTYPGREQALRPGSFAVVRGGVLLPQANGFGLALWVWPTRLAGRPQVVARAWTAAACGYSLELDADGRPVLELGGPDKRIDRLVGAEPLALRSWYRLTVSVEGSTGRASLSCRAERSLGTVAWTVEAESRVPAAGNAPFTLAVALDEGRPSRHFNGKLESPALFARALTQRDAEALARGVPPWKLDPPPIAAWDFARDPGGVRLHDVSGAHDGELVNQPARAVTGHSWSGRALDFNHAPGEYAAAHFHDDDLEDAGWEPAFSFTVPEDIQSGFYAVRLTTGKGSDTLPFVVRPPAATAWWSVLLLAPTLTYRAYANEHESWYERETGVVRPGYESRLSAEDEEIVRAGLLSLYDRHSDGSGTTYVSLLRPQLTMRPHLTMPVSGAPHGLAADLHLVDWLEQRGTSYDVVADEDLHEEGRSLLDRYAVVLTGSHPEYWTEQMLDALTAYVEDGGRLMYLGGNGFYWVTSITPDRPHLLEVRRGFAGTGPFRSEPGEAYHSSTGEPGGLWRFRGRAPQKLTGVGFAAMGHVGARAYERAAGLDSRAAFVFDGVPDGEPIGSAGLCLGAAASLEVDRLDRELGTPPEAILLASATGFPNAYTPAGEDVTTAAEADSAALVRADMVYVEHPSGGAVFSVGSIGWCGALSADGYTGAVARITGNVLDRFADCG